MEIRYFSRLLQKNMWLFFVSILIALNLSLFISYFVTEKRYEAQALFIVSPNIQSFESERDVVNSLQALDKRSIIATYAEVLNSKSVFDEAIQYLGSDPEMYIGYQTSAVVLPEANIIQFTVQGPDAEITSALTNGIGQYAVDFINDRYSVYQFDFVDKAEVPQFPYQPKVLTNTVFAIIIGIAIGLGVILIKEQLSSTIDSLKQRGRIDNESLALSRTSFESNLREEFSAQPDKVFTLGFVYLNGIQDLYGSLPQAFISEIMKKVTETLQFYLRGNDIVGRWSQLRFSILLPSTDGDSARRLMIRIQEMLAQSISLGGSEEFTVLLDPRIGLVSRQSGESFNTLVDQAEQALELARQSDSKIELFRVRPFI